MTDPNEKEIFASIDWSTDMNYTGYEDEADEDDIDAEMNHEFDALMTDVNLGTDN